MRVKNDGRTYTAQDLAEAYGAGHYQASREFLARLVDAEPESKVTQKLLAKLPVHPYMLMPHRLSELEEVLARVSDDRGGKLGE